MLAALFRSNQPAVLLAAPLLAIGLFLPAFWSEPAAAGQALMPLAGLAQRLLGASAAAHASAGMALLAFATVQLTLLMNDLELMDRRNHLVLLLFPVALAGLGRGGVYDPALLGLPFALGALRRTWALNSTGTALARLFDAGLLIGLAALCYLPHALLLPVVWASASLIRPFAWREYVLPALGAAVCFYLAWGAMALTDAGPWLPLRTVMAPEPDALAVWGDPPRRAFAVLLGLVLAVGLAAFAGSHARSVMRGKNLRSALMAMALSMVVTLLLLDGLKGSAPAVLAALPASAIGAYALLLPRRAWMAEAAAWGLLVLAAWARWA